MTDETKQENPEMTAATQADSGTTPPITDDAASSLADGGLTLDDSDTAATPPQEAAAPAKKPADDIPETSLSLEMDDDQAAPAPVEETPAPTVEATAIDTPVMDEPVVETPIVEQSAAPVFDDTEMSAEAPMEPAAMTGVASPPPPPVVETPQENFTEEASGGHDEFPEDDTTAFAGDDGGDDGFGGDDFGDDGGNMMPPPEKSGSKKKILMAGGALALAAVIGGGYFVLSSADDGTTPPKQVVKIAAQAPAPTALPDTGTDFAAANTTGQADVTGMTPPPQPTPLTNTNSIAGDTDNGTELASIAIAETNAIPRSDTWDMNGDNAMDSFDTADMPDDAALTALAVDGQTAVAETDTIDDYDPSRATITTIDTGIDAGDNSLPPPPVDAEAEAATLDFSTTDTATTTADAGDTPAIDPLAAAENIDPLTGATSDFGEDNGFKDTPPVEISDLEPPSMMATAIKDTAAPQMAEDNTATTTPSLTEPQVDAAIAPKANDPLTPAPSPGEPPPLLSNTQQVKDMMPPTKPELTAEEKMRIEQARMALSKGDLEGDAIEEHKKTLREVPAKEAMIRPLPKAYLIVNRADGKSGSRPQTKPQQAGTPLANISTKPDLLRQAIAEQRAGNTAGALQSYEKILSANPSDLNALTNMLGILRKQHGELALEKLTELHGLYPGHPGIAAQLAVTYADKKSYAEALHYFDVAASLDKPNAYYPFSKGVILDRMGRRGEANSYYQDALTMLEQGKTGHQKVPLNALRKRLGIPAY